MKKNNDGKWCWAQEGGEGYYGSYDTEAEAHDAAQAEARMALEPGAEAKYQIATLAHPLDLIGPYAISRAAEAMVESLKEAAYEEVGGEDDAFEIDSDCETELMRAAMKLLRERASITRYGVKNVEKHTYVVPGIAGATRATAIYPTSFDDQAAAYDAQHAAPADPDDAQQGEEGDAS